MTAEQTIYSVVFYLVSAVTVVAALGVVRARDMVRTALLLVLALSGVAGIYVLLSADFLAVAQILIYVGAIMILMLFAIMLTPGHVELPPMAGEGQRVAAFLVAAIIFVITTGVAITHDWKLVSQPLNAPTAEQIGGLLLGTYVLPFEIASVLLTVAMIGAIVIAREDQPR